MPSLFKTLAVAFAATAAVVALPADVDDFVPGPGLPSLEELGMTKEDLYKPIPEEVLKSIQAEYGGLTKRYTPTCGSTNRASHADAVACYNYLNGLGTTSCVVPNNAGGAGNINFCKIGSAYWTGSCLAGTCPGSSYCRDVARGGLWVLNNCNVGGQVRGSNAAWGNGNLIVGIQNYGA
ncbi:hypothetical protein CC1G_08684 [Coprinopsis cinerea okayama7|uniref:Secreted protein n=1 Tax=Coprinopsis cinerea (strain Okayama-7 / 130 / ATCC MYA-4618 / FGSC 9003) TaxID=240176 RepID=A8NZG1_COPC7|nr:hypothetical protein CC1G_08684 [Coprinopsis cinerea okayama7\|eukprot:XP_001837671.1 hypothetical protein CC1G_08684 [Coprinopsis cinerea okayama7\